jgi:hypothetical protein
VSNKRAKMYKHLADLHISNQHIFPQRYASLDNSRQSIRCRNALATSVLCDPYFMASRLGQAVHCKVYSGTRTDEKGSGTENGLELTRHQQAMDDTSLYEQVVSIKSNVRVYIYKHLYRN